MTTMVKQWLAGSIVLGSLLGGGFNLYSPGSMPAALAQSGVDEATRVQVYERVKPAVVAIETQDGVGSGSLIEIGRAHV